MDSLGADEIAKRIRTTVQKSGENAPIYLRYSFLFIAESMDTHAASVNLQALI
jgi:hypothetical protein